MSKHSTRQIHSAPSLEGGRRESPHIAPSRSQSELPPRPLERGLGGEAKSAFLVGAPTSGSGKTTFTMGLLRALRQRGLSVQPFKCGPDYIDTKFHERMCGRPSINLDTFMASSEHVRELFSHYGQAADVCVVEGMMGLFDGFDRDRGSSAEIAQVLGIPVVLVVDAKSAAYSIAALLQGFLHFREKVRIGGVVFNRVGSAKHQRMLQQVCDDLRLTCFGYLPKTQALEQGSRYLGLDFSEPHPLTSEPHPLTPKPHPLTPSPRGEGEAFGGKGEADKLATLMEEYVDIDALLALRAPVSQQQDANQRPMSQAGKVLVARNAESFSFIYQENLDRWQDVSFFDPEYEVPQLDAIDLLYLPGGYPEKHLDALVANQAAREAIRAYANRGGRIIAECGGMMYLCERIVTDHGEYPMCGVLPYTITARSSDHRLSLGYRRFVLDGKEYRGHEFHYTQFLDGMPQSVVQVYNAVGEPVGTPVFRYKNVLASYTHLYVV